MGRKALKNKLDMVFSKVVRAAGKCAKCGRSGGVQLQCSHILSRRYMNVRWDLRNAKCLCASCHFWWGQNPLEATEWVRTIRTDKELKEIRRLANEPFRKTDAELLELYDELKNKL